MTSTPVTPAPLVADKQAELQSSVVGSWRLVAETQQGGARKQVKGTTTMTFLANGTMSYNYSEGVSLMSWGFDVGRKYGWGFDGANLALKPDFLIMRVDAWTPTTLDVFVYAFSYHWHFERLPEQRAGS